MNRYLISDIHGCLNTMEAMLDKLAFSTSDELYIIGDCLDKGPDSKGVVDRLFALKASGYKIKCTRGNHEELILRDIDTPDFTFHVPETWASFNIKSFSELHPRYVKWMRSLPLYLELDDAILVHAGLNFSMPDPYWDKQALLFIRNWYRTIDRNWLGDRFIVHGHTPVDQDSIKYMLKNLDRDRVIDIDNGCVLSFPGMGRLCALNLTNRELTFVKCRDKH